MLTLPENPRYLVEKGDNTAAAEVLACPESSTATINDPEVIFLRKQIETSLEIESAAGPFRYSELFRVGKIQNFRRVCLCCAINLMQQFTVSLETSPRSSEAAHL